MKRLFTLFIAFVFTTSAFAQNEVECAFTSISTDIDENRTLSSSTLYRVEGCIHVTDGAILTIPQGTIVLFEKASHAGLIVDKGSYIDIQGTSAYPVVFTSDQKPTFRNRGDYSGLIINGEATNNFSSNVMTTENRTCNIDAGGNDDNDNSGSIEFLRMEYAEYGLTLASVGRNTVLQNIMVSYPLKSSFEFLGGTAQAKNLVSFSPVENDFVFNYGNRSKVQQAMGLRHDAATHYGTAPYSNGILMANNDNSGGGFSGSPETHPILDKFTIAGPGYCGATGLHSDFYSGVLFSKGTEGGLYNSVITGWDEAFRLDDALTISNAAANNPSKVRFESNSFYNNVTNLAPLGGSWPTSPTPCSPSFSSWVGGSGACGQQFNQTSSSGIGWTYSSICDNYCLDNTPSFLMSEDDLDDAEYDNIAELDNDAFFTTSSFRGAFDETTDWTEGWTLFCPQSKDYCPSEQRMGKATGIKGTSLAKDNGLLLSPNPVNGITYAEFSTEQACKVTLNIVNSLGQIVRTVNTEAGKGKQRVALNTEGLSSGMYIVNVELSKGNAVHARIVVK